MSLLIACRDMLYIGCSNLSVTLILFPSTGILLNESIKNWRSHAMTHFMGYGTLSMTDYGGEGS